MLVIHLSFSDMSCLSFITSRANKCWLHDSFLFDDLLSSMNERIDSMEGFYLFAIDLSHFKIKIFSPYWALCMWSAPSAQMFYLIFLAIYCLKIEITAMRQRNMTVISEIVRNTNSSCVSILMCKVGNNILPILLYVSFVRLIDSGGLVDIGVYFTIFFLLFLHDIIYIFSRVRLNCLFSLFHSQPWSCDPEVLILLHYWT